MFTTLFSSSYAGPAPWTPVNNTCEVTGVTSVSNGYKTGVQKLQSSVVAMMGKKKEWPSTTP